MYKPNSVTTAAVAYADEPVQLADLYTSLRLTTLATSPISHPDDLLLKGYIATARSMIEAMTGRLLVDRAVTVKYQGFDDYLVLPYPNTTTTLTSVVYKDLNNVAQTLDLDDLDYEIIEMSGNWYIYIRGTTPVTYSKTVAVSVTYTAGYTTAPQALLDAIKLIVMYMYDRPDQPIPEHVIHALVSPYMTNSVHGYAT